MSIASRKRKLAIFDKVSLCAYLKRHAVLFSEVKFGGPPRKINALSVALRARRHSVNVLTFHSERPFSRERLDIEGVTVQYLPWAGRKLRQFSASLGPIAESVQQC